jgi:hypothetical protein
LFAISQYFFGLLDSFLDAVAMNIMLADMEIEFYLTTQGVNFGDQFLCPYSAQIRH